MNHTLEEFRNNLAPLIVDVQEGNPMAWDEHKNAYQTITLGGLTVDEWSIFPCTNGIPDENLFRVLYQSIYDHIMDNNITKIYVRRLPEIDREIRHEIDIFDYVNPRIVPVEYSKIRCRLTFYNQNGDYIPI